MNNLTPPEFDEKNAKTTVKQGHIDYFCGRAIKTNLLQDSVDPYRYDKYAGKIGSFKKVVDSFH